MKLSEVLKNGIYVLKEKNIEDSIFKARVLLAYTINQPKEYLITHDDEEINIDTQIKYYSILDRLTGGEPLQYILEKQEFMELNFYVNKNVLIPQPDTEILVQAVDKYFKHINGKEDVKLFQNFEKSTLNNPQILDMCTGSGAIAISLKKLMPNCNILASDVSQLALEVAKKNAIQNNVEVNFVQSNLFENIVGKFDIIVSNPPYIETDLIEDLPIEVKNEPHIALDGGKDGLDFYRKIISKSLNYLTSEGMLFLEIGYNQRQNVIHILEKNGFKDIISIKDYAGNDRVIIASV